MKVYRLIKMDVKSMWIELWICILLDMIILTSSQGYGYHTSPVPAYRPEDRNYYIAAYLNHMKAWADAAQQTNSLKSFKETFKHHLPHISRLAEMGQGNSYHGNQLPGNINRNDPWLLQYMKQFEEQYLSQQPKRQAYDVNYNGLSSLYAPQEVVYSQPEVIIPPPAPPVIQPLNYATVQPIQGQSPAVIPTENTWHNLQSPNFANFMPQTNQHQPQLFNNNLRLNPTTITTVSHVSTAPNTHVEQYSFPPLEHLKGQGLNEVIKHEEKPPQSQKWSPNENRKHPWKPPPAVNNGDGHGRYSGTQTMSPAWFTSAEVRDPRPAAPPHSSSSPSSYSDKMDSMVETGCMDMMRKKRGIMGDHVTWDMLENVCHQCMAWSRACRLGAKQGSKIPSPEIMTWWNGLMEVESRDRKHRRHRRQARRLPQRREYRLLSDEERHRFHEAVIGLKNTFVGDMSRYDVFVLFHQPTNSPAAHFGPAFYGWHREMLTRFENALQQIDDRVVLPYWDSRMDGYLGDTASRESITWTDAFLGNLDGEVTSGPFAGFRLLNTVDGRDRLFRQRDGGRLLTDADVANAVNSRSFRDLTFYVDPSFETAHGSVHNWIGGVFGDLMQSPSDPIFFLHHAFIDCVWEAHRRNSGNYSDYPNDAEALGVGNLSPNGDRARSTGDSIHHPEAPLRPFDGLLNVDAHSRYYTDREYSCATPPTCSERRNCGSPYLFCDVDTGVCLPRLRLGAQCDDFGGFNPCYDARCCNGRCSRECGNNRRNSQRRNNNRNDRGNNNRGNNNRVNNNNNRGNNRGNNNRGNNGQG